ncbi:MAG: BTAD domain-containing putative transcriptional regulator [Bacillota bacterium]
MDFEVHLSTKLSRPRTVRYHLPRTHLLDLMKEGLSRRLTALIATAGHGKTSSLAHFLTEVEHASLWLQLDAHDSDLQTFLRYLAFGIHRELHGGSRLLTALESGRTITDPLPLLVADLQATVDHHVIVLDDFHLIDRGSPVIGLVSGLVQYCSEKTHLYICSRTPLPFSTARFKVIQEAAELTEDDFRFTRSEIQTFLQNMTHMQVNEDQLDQICHLTEGWSAALVLLATGIRRRGALDSLLSGALPSDLFAYLADEVFHSLSPSLQQFMEESSILDICTPTACDDVLGRQDSAALLSQLISANLLITQLGPDSLRYHHLLQRFLQERLKARETGDFARLHKQAGDWFLTQEDPGEAVKHYLRGGWVQEAAGLVESLAPLWLRTNRVERLRGLLAHLPPSIKEQYPWMSICEARHLLNSGHADHAVGMARMALRAFEEYGDQRGVVQAHLLLGEAFAVRQEFTAAEEEFRKSANALQPDFRYEEGMLLHKRAALAYATKLFSETLEADLRRALSLFVELGDLPGEAGVSELLGIIRAQQGDYASAVQHLERSASLMRSMGEPPHEVGINLAWVYGQVSRFADVAQICEPILASSTRKTRRAYAAIYLLHAYTHLGDFTRAATIAPTANSLVEELGSNELKTTLTVELSTLYRLFGQSRASVPFVNEALQLVRNLSARSHLSVKPVLEAVLLHLFHTGNNSSAARLADKLLSRNDAGAYHLETLLLTLARAVAEFRLSRTESRPEAVRILQEGLSACRRRGDEFFVLHEWQLALAVCIYGLAYDVHADFCADLIRLMSARLPTTVLQQGIGLAESEARLLPAAWQALPDDAVRASFATLLTSQDRKRVVSLATGGPAPLHIQALGPLVVHVGGSPIDIKALKKRKSGLLLVLLLSADNPLPREQVMDRFWPDLDPGAADTSLRVSLHHLRRILEPHLGGKQKSRYIQTEGGLLWFSRQPEVQVDLDHFREALRQATEAKEKGNLREAATRYESACKLYHGDLAADDPYALEDLREVWRSKYTDALDWLGEYYWHEAQNGAKAILTYQQRLSLDESYEPAHQSLMRIYMETGQVAKARQQYLTCKEVLSSQLGVEPSRTTESLLQLLVSMESESTALPDPPPQRKGR